LNEGQSAAFKPAGQWNRLHISLKDKAFTPMVNGKDFRTQALLTVLEEGPFILRPEGEMDFANLLVRPLKE
jgi:hypothetical protein